MKFEVFFKGLLNEYLQEQYCIPNTTYQQNIHCHLVGKNKER